MDNVDAIDPSLPDGGVHQTPRPGLYVDSVEVPLHAVFDGCCLDDSSRLGTLIRASNNNVKLGNVSIKVAEEEIVPPSAEIVPPSAEIASPAPTDVVVESDEGAQGVYC